MKGQMAGLEEVRRALGESRRWLRGRGRQAKGAISRAALAKSGAHLDTCGLIVGLVGSRSGVERTRLLLSAFDAAWLGWNAIYSRTAEPTEAGDRRQHLAAAGCAWAAGIERQAAKAALRGAVDAFAAELARPSRRATGEPPVREARPVAIWVAHAGREVLPAWRLRMVERRLSKASRARGELRPKQEFEASVSALYEMRCRRLHGDLVASTVGSQRSMERLCVAAIALVARLVAARIEIESSPGSRRPRETRGRLVKE